MSAIFDASSATVTLADFVTVDALGKVNMVGGGISVLGFNPAQKVSTPFGVLVEIVCPSPPPEPVAAIEVTLLDSADEVVSLLDAERGQQAMRVAQNVNFQEPNLPGVLIPRGAIDITAHMVLTFGAGIPVAPSQAYRWRVSIDGEPKAETKFFVAGPPVGPVLG